VFPACDARSSFSRAQPRSIPWTNALSCRASHLPWRPAAFPLSLALGFCFSCTPWSPTISRWPRCLRVAAFSSSTSSSISLRRYSVGWLLLPGRHAASSLLSSLAIASSLPALSPAACFVSCSLWSASPPVPCSDRASSTASRSSARCAPCSTVSIQCVVIDGYPLRVYPKIAACAGIPVCSTLSGCRTPTPLIFSSPLCRPPFRCPLPCPGRRARCD
jgi:hypothetical protein